MKKTCKNCNQEKELETEFYYSRTKDTYEGQCKTCRCAKLRIHKRKVYNPEMERIKHKLYRQSGRAVEVGIKTTKKHHDKYVARYTLHNAIVSGKVIRQLCEVCGDKKSHGHHDDYSQPLSVRWLCKKHHGEVHRKQTNDVPLTVFYTKKARNQTTLSTS